MLAGWSPELRVQGSELNRKELESNLEALKVCCKIKHVIEPSWQG